MQSAQCRGLALFEKGDFEAAQSEFKKLNDNPRGKYDLARCKIELGDTAGALQLFKECLLNNHGGDFLYCRRAYYFLGQLTGSATYYKQGARLGDCECAYMYGIELYQKDERLKAARWMRLAVSECNPLRGNAFYALGAIYLKMANQRVTGVKYVETAVKEGCEAAEDLLLQMSCAVPKTLSIPYTCSAFETALVLHHNGDTEKGIAMLSKGVAKLPLVHYAMGLMYLSLKNRHSTGVAYICKAATADFPNEEAVAFLAKLESFV